MIILSISRLAINFRYYYPMDRNMKEYTSGIELIEKNKVVLGIASDVSPNVHGFAAIYPHRICRTGLPMPSTITA